MNNLLLQALVKKAASPINEEDSDISFRHYFLPAQLAALQGLSPGQQRQANWDALKLTAGGAGTSATLALLGSLLGGYVTDDKKSGKLLGGLIGGVAGLPIGTYLTHKLIQSNRDLGPEYGPKLSNLYGLFTPKAALSLLGVSSEDQKQVTKDLVKLLGGRYIGSSLSGSDNRGLGGLVGNAMVYKNLRDDRMRTLQYNSMQLQLLQLQNLFNLAKTASISLQYGLTKQALKPETLTSAAKKVGKLIALNPEYINKYPKLSALLYGRTRAADEIRAARKFSSNGDIINHILGRASIGQDSHIGGSISAMKYAQLLRDKTNAAVIGRHNKALFKDIGSFDDLGDRVINANAYRRNAAQGFVPYDILMPKQKFDMYKKYKLGKGGNFLYF